jgi:hypothetical protein
MRQFDSFVADAGFLNVLHGADSPERDMSEKALMIVMEYANGSFNY